MALCEVNQEFESQRFQLQQANRLADQAQRDKISLYGELELRNRLFQESQAKDCQEIEELRRICCEETDLAIQARIDELSMHQERNTQYLCTYDCESITAENNTSFSVKFSARVFIDVK